MKHIKKVAISKDIAQYGRNLEKRLDAIELDNVDAIRDSERFKTLRKKIFSISKLTDLLNVAIDYQDTVDSKIRQKKLEYILEQYIQRCEDTRKRLASIVDLQMDTYGSILFNKFIRIAANSAPDRDFYYRLSLLFERIAESDFRLQFEEHKFVLDLIDKLSPQALVILCDHSNWPQFRQENLELNNTIVLSDFSNIFSMAYAKKKGLVSDAAKRLSHTIFLLQRDNYIEARLEKNKSIQVYLTATAKFLLPYIVD